MMANVIMYNPFCHKFRLYTKFTRVAHMAPPTLFGDNSHLT